MSKTLSYASIDMEQKPRAIAKAVRLMLVIGILLELLGIAVIGLGIVDYGKKTGFDKIMELITAVMVFVMLVIPATLYIVSSIYLRKEKRWASTLGLIMTWIQIPLMGLGLLSSVAMTVLRKPNLPGIVVFALWGWGLIRILSRLREARKYLDS